MCKKYEVGRSKATAQPTLLQPAKSSLLPLLLPTLLLLKPLLLLTSQMATSGLAPALTPAPALTVTPAPAPTVTPESGRGPGVLARRPGVLARRPGKAREVGAATSGGRLGQ